MNIRHQQDSYGRVLTLYGVENGAPHVNMVGDVRVTADLPAALELVTSPDFDARTMAVVSGEIEPLASVPGGLKVLASGPTHLEVRTTSQDTNLMVWQRSFLPLFRATMDGVAVPLEVVNLSRIGVRVPPGDHLIEILLDTRPFWRSFLAWPLAAILLSWVVVRWASMWSGEAPALLPGAARRESAKP